MKIDKISIRSEGDLKKRVIIYLNGIRQTRCISASVKLFAVRRYMTDEKGNIRFTKHGDFKAHTEIMYGDVKIVDPMQVLE